MIVGRRPELVALIDGENPRFLSQTLSFCETAHKLSAFGFLRSIIRWANFNSKGSE